MMRIFNEYNSTKGRIMAEYEWMKNKSKEKGELKNDREREDNAKCWCIEKFTSSPY